MIQENPFQTPKASDTPFFKRKRITKLRTAVYGFIIGFCFASICLAIYRAELNPHLALDDVTYKCGLAVLAEQIVAVIIAVALVFVGFMGSMLALFARSMRLI